MQIPAYQLKGGDVIAEGEVFDTEPTLRRRFAIVLVDGRRVEVANDEVLVTVQ